MVSNIQTALKFQKFGKQKGTGMEGKSFFYFLKKFFHALSQWKNTGSSSPLHHSFHKKRALLALELRLCWAPQDNRESGEAENFQEQIKYLKMQINSISYLFILFKGQNYNYHQL